MIRRKELLAQYRHVGRFLCSNLFVDGRRAEKSEFLSWPRLRRVAVRFSAVKLPASLSHKCQVREEGAEQTRFT